jgi:predicted nucleic acid-binding protein
VDASLWIDFTRTRSSRSLKDLISPYILDPDARLAEVVRFEVLRYASREESRQIEAQFQTIPMLATPSNLWTEAATLGQRCRQEGVSAGSLDLLIATVAIHHDAELITFDLDFERIAAVSALRVKWLARPAQ